MLNNEFKLERTIGGQTVLFANRTILKAFHMPVPANFVEDTTLAGIYTFLYSPESSPLGIAIKYSPMTGNKHKQIAVYFGQEPDSLERTSGAKGDILYRETRSRGQTMGVYSLRFAVEREDGFLFGCFNCRSEEGDNWRDTVLDMLRAIQPGDGQPQ